MEPDIGYVALALSAVLWVVVTVLALRGRGRRTSVRTRDISGQVIVGNVTGGVHQRQASGAPAGEAGPPGPARRFGRWVVWIGLLASILTIVGFVLHYGFGV